MISWASRTLFAIQALLCTCWYTARHALEVSIGVTLLALLVFGYVKGRFTGKTPVRSALQTAVVGGLAAAAAFGIAKLIA
jgi:VIT1/CCC1 family predicted Fe2+/Mn2+ transporter